MEEDEPVPVKNCDLVSDDIRILNANQLNSSFLVDKDIGIFNANYDSFSEETCDKLSYS